MTQFMDFSKRKNKMFSSKKIVLKNSAKEKNIIKEHWSSFPRLSHHTCTYQFCKKCLLHIFSRYISLQKFHIRESANLFLNPLNDTFSIFQIYQHPVSCEIISNTNTHNTHYLFLNLFCKLRLFQSRHF